MGAGDILRRRMMGKRSQAETQLHWIFILIVGALILSFFIFIVVKQKAASEAKFSGKVAQQLNTILVGAKVSSGTVQDIPTPEVSIRFTCNDYYIGPASQRLGNKVVFAPEYVEGTRITTWTLDWNVPFKVASFLYITSPLVRYVVVAQSETDSSATKILSALPAKMNKDAKVISFSDYADVKDDGDRYIRFIFVNPQQSTFNIPSAFANSKASLSGLTVDTTSRQVQFLVKSTSSSGSFTTDGNKHTYLKDEELYGAIFSDKSDEFECLMTRAYSRLNMVSKVYYEKLNELAPSWEGTGCEGYYRKNVDLEAMDTATSSYPPAYTTIGSVMSSLKESNTRLQLQSCPLIY
jgi:hypothetical protein